MWLLFRDQRSTLEKRSAMSASELMIQLHGFVWKLSLNVVSKKTKTIKMIGHHSRFRDVMGQSYSIYA